MNRNIAVSIAALGTALASATPASATLTIFAASDATTNSIGYTNEDTYTHSDPVAATTVKHPAAAAVLNVAGNYNNKAVGVVIKVKAVTTLVPLTTTVNSNGTTVTQSYTTTTTPAYTLTVTTTGAHGFATKNVPKYTETTAGSYVVNTLTSHSGVLANISNVSTGAYAGSTLTNFSYLNNALASDVTGRASYFTLNATSSTNATSTTIAGFGTILTQPLLTGTFQFVSATAFDIGSRHVHIGDIVNRRSNGTHFKGISACKRGPLLARR